MWDLLARRQSGSSCGQRHRVTSEKKNPQTLKQLTGTLSKWNGGRRHKAFHSEAEAYFCFFFFLFFLWVAEERWAKPTLLLWNLTADGLIRSLQSLVESCSRWIDLYSVNHLLTFSTSLGQSLTVRGGYHSRKCSGLNLSTCRWRSCDPKCFCYATRPGLLHSGFPPMKLCSWNGKGKVFFFFFQCLHHQAVLWGLHEWRTKGKSYFPQKMSLFKKRFALFKDLSWSKPAVNREKMKKIKA